MSSTQIQLDRDSEVSVQTQSITARSSVRNGTRRKLRTVETFLNTNYNTAGDGFRCHILGTLMQKQTIKLYARLHEPIT